ncbi:MAG TPA: type IV pilin protein [Dyella sp.]|uniref:type IV pilin protein n=1 Tax=Dyella sp. TaxID=1869338 RepID=UPI002C2581AB|nr:type IV pilin protein [Dyella sp.]HTV85701.1 type IV pilin protein [Dyella sp.]
MNHPLPRGRYMSATHRSHGYTLIELMIVVGIVVILAAIALPSYTRQIQQSRRTSAKTALLDVASREERYYAVNNSYTTLANLGYTNLSGNNLLIPSASQDYYNVSVTVGTPTSSYTVTAVPQGTQASDTCGTYTLTGQGVQSDNGTASNCW